MAGHLNKVMGGIMLIGKDYKVESDEMNVTLFERHVSTKSGTEYWSAIGYYSTPKQCLKAIVDRKIKGTGLKDLETVVKKIDELYGLIASLQLPKPAFSVGCGGDS
jgi:hypothetical protein